MPIAHVDAFELELKRLARALDADDEGDAIGCLKTSAEAIAKIVHDLNGAPVPGAASYDSTVNRAHNLLANQKGHLLAHEDPFANLATQASKIVRGIGAIRNDYGSGHGKARQPQLKGEMLALAQDGTLMWLRWALRRLDAFAQGRPEKLIGDIIGNPFSINFYSGDLTQRLADANLAAIDPSHARAIGVAVGQRAASGTFNVSIEGVKPALTSADMEEWPAPYRVGVANGLLFDPAGNATITANRLLRALQICLPATTTNDDLAVLIGQVITATPSGMVAGDAEELTELRALIERQAPLRPANEKASWESLGRHLSVR